MSNTVNSAIKEMTFAEVDYTAGGIAPGLAAAYVALALAGFVAGYEITDDVVEDNKKKD